MTEMDFEDRMSNCQSLCSNYHPSSQSRKISIGITAESLAKKKPVVAKEDETAVPKAEKVNPCDEILTAANNRSVSAKNAAAEKQTEAPDQVSYPWITTPSLKQNATTSETAYCRKQASTRPAAGGRQEKINGLKDLQMTHTHSVQFFANKSFILQSGESNPKLFDGMTYKRKGMKNRKSKCAEEFMFTTTQEVLVSDKAVKAGKRDNGENGQTETLRMKLWQILGTVSSPKSQCSNPQSAEVGADRLEPEKVVDQIGDTAGRPRQNSDTIEADSESPDQPKRRRLNQSLTRKNCSKVPKTKTKTKIGPSSGNKQKYQKKNIFLFEEGRNAKFIGAADYGSSMFTRKNSHLKSSTIKLHKISFPQKDNANEPKQANYISELPCAEKTSSLSNKVESFLGCMPEDREDCGKSRNTVPVKDFHESPKGAVPAEDFHESPKNAVPVKDFHESPQPKNMNHKRDLDNPTLTENRDQREDSGKTASRNVVDSTDEILSPTFAFKTPIVSPSPWSTPRTVQMEQDIFSPALEERRHNMGSIRSFRTLRNSKSDCSGSDAETDSPDDAEKLKDSPPRKASPVKGKNDSENGQAELSSDGTEDDLGGCSSEDGDPRSSREGSPVISIYDYHKENSPETVTAEKSNFMHCPTNQFCGHGGISFQEFSTPLTSAKGMEETEWFQETPDQNQGDDLDRTITLFAIALDNFRRKMDSETRKKSSEILTSISEGICLRLLDVESQIQTDVGKLTSASKSKRKHLETRFEEHKEQLEFICKKFEEDIHHHLQNFTSTLKALEADQIELKGKVKKQRTSHQKLLLQLEEAVEAQLSDAQRRITTVHELARKKRLQLKLLIAECLKEGKTLHNNRL